MNRGATGSFQRRLVYRQRLLPWLERQGRRERSFKRAIVCATTLAVLGLLAGTSHGRSGSLLAARRLLAAVRDTLGLPPGRAAIEAEQRSRRRRGIEQTRETYRAFFAHDASPGLRQILGAARMAPEEVLLRWANLEWTIILSPLVFQADDHGRSYRMRPDVRSFWLADHTLTRGLHSFFFLPDTPDVRAAVRRAGAAIMPESYQTTNSWGCRGPEPDPAAPVRVLVLGDSFMQGIFVPDDETPPEHLRRTLTRLQGRAVSVLNTGHIGYSPEQYYYTLCEYQGRFRPHFVVVSVCPNDFGTTSPVREGTGDWSEAGYWLGAIAQLCRTRRTPCLLVTLPLETQILNARKEADYPGRVASLWDGGPFAFLDLGAPFIDEHLRVSAELIRAGRRPQTSPLYNGHLDDAHLSPRGAAVWGEVVARRLNRLLDYQRAHEHERAGRKDAALLPSPRPSPGIATTQPSSAAGPDRNR